ncbi:GGDEF domain-containing response regulator [Paraglaciecola aestuariivivens]
MFDQGLISTQESRILVVEDDEVSALISMQALSDIYQAHHVSSGQAALDFCENTPPDIVLMDINMPGMSGLEACLKLKQNPETKHIPVIFITAHSDPQSEDDCWDAGCVDFITKPFSIKTLRHRVNSHLAVKQLTDKLMHLATYDALTKIQNRRFFDGFILEQAKLAARNNNSLGLLMIDIDYFKQYNDTYGHVKGDECLIAVANALTDIIGRPTDCVARYGGEEFAVVLPDTDSKGVEHVAISILNAIRDLNIPHSESEFGKLTVSIGGTIIKNGSLAVEQAIIKADELLYQAKDNGRNTLVVP